MVYDQHGNVLGDASSATDPTLDNTLGAKVWRWLHPDQEAAEYVDSGITPPPPTTATDVIEQAASNVQQTATAAFDTGFSLTKWIVVGLGFYALIQVMNHVPAAKGHLNEYRKRASGHLKKYRKRAAKLIEG